MKVVFIANGITGSGGLPGVSGGDVRFIEIGKRLRRAGVEIHVLSSQAGITLCKKLGLDATFHITDIGGGPTAWVLLKRALKAYPLKEFNDAVIYSTSDLLCDTLPAVRLKKASRTKWVAAVHWIEGLPWQRGLRLGPSWIDGGLLCLNQRFSIAMIKRFAEIILAVSNHTARQVRDLGIAEERINAVECGVDYQLINKLTAAGNVKRFDAFYMKRFQPSKGIFDTIEIWERVCRQVRDAKLALVGHGPKRVVAHIKRLIEQKKLEKNIEYLGIIYDVNKKFKLMKESRLLIHPSYEENWAIVISEAMACGLPVVAYDLPIFKDIYPKGMIRVPIGDIEKFANQVLNLLSDQLLYEKISREAMNITLKYDWDNVAEEELEILRSLLDSE